MARPEHDWYLQDWLAHFGKVQNDLHTELHYHKNTMSRLWHGDQPYRKDSVNKISAWLNIRPYELLMHPDDAFRLRRLEASVEAEVRRMGAISQEPAAQEQEAPEPKRRKAG